MTQFTRFRRRMPVAALALAAVALVGATLISPLPGLQGTSTASAQLLEGPGFRIPHDFRVSMVGAYRAPDGSLAYCIEWGQEPPSLPSDPAHQSSIVTQYAGWSAAEVARVNWLIGTYGQQVNDEQAAAVGVAIWLRHPGDGGEKFHAAHRFFIAAIPDDAVRARVVAEAQRLNTLADAYQYLPLSPSGDLRVVPDPSDTMRGEIVLSGVQDGARGTLTVTGAQLRGAADEGGGATVAPVAAGTSRLQYRLTPGDDEIGMATVRVDAAMIVRGGSAGPALRVWQSAPEMQDVAAVGPVAADVAWKLGAEAQHSITFSPVLSTQVPTAVIAEGESLADTVQLALAPGSAPWRRFTDGSTLPVTVVCQAFGPFETAPVQSSEVPEGTSAAVDTVRVQVGGGDSDPLSHPVAIDYTFVPTGGGYFSSVCGIDAAEQDAPASVRGLPRDYRFFDAFGLAEETQFSPVGVRFDTTLSDAQVLVGARVVDVIVGVPAGGPWAEWAGKQVVVPLSGTVYWTAERPDRTTEVPAEAEAVLDVRAELVGPGQRAEVEIDLPDRAGWYTVRWCTDLARSASDVGAPLVRLWCDDYGIPSETVHAVNSVAAAQSSALVRTGSDAAALSASLGLLAILGGFVLLRVRRAVVSRSSTTARPRRLQLRDVARSAE